MGTLIKPMVMLPDQMGLLGTGVSVSVFSVLVSVTARVSPLIFLPNFHLTSSFCLFSKIPFHGSFLRLTTVNRLSSVGFNPFLTSPHSKGQETVASGMALRLYGVIIVRPWLF